MCKKNDGLRAICGEYFSALGLQKWCSSEYEFKCGSKDVYGAVSGNILSFIKKSALRFHIRQNKIFEWANTKGLIKKASLQAFFTTCEKSIHFKILFVRTKTRLQHRQILSGEQKLWKKCAMVFSTFHIFQLSFSPVVFCFTIWKGKSLELAWRFGTNCILLYYNSNGELTLSSWRIESAPRFCMGESV